MKDDGYEKHDDSYYEQFIIKEYTHWKLLIEEKQRYLGQAVVWLKRDGDMQRLSSLSEPERTELWREVLPEYERAIHKLWQPDHMNYAWLGNLFTLHNGHGHLHLIPRYAESRVFEGRTFADDRWGQNYVPYTQESVSTDEALAVRAALAQQLET